MKTFILLLLCSVAVYADANTNNVVTATDNYLGPPDTFSELNERFRGAGLSELTYKKHRLVVYFSCGAHGPVYSQPFAYFEMNGRPVRILTAMDCPGYMDAVIEGDNLVIRRWNYENKKKTFITFDLSALDAG